MKAKAKTACLFNVLQVASFREEDEARTLPPATCSVVSPVCAFASGVATLKEAALPSE